MGIIINKPLSPKRFEIMVIIPELNEFNLLQQIIKQYEINPNPVHLILVTK